MLSIALALIVSQNPWQWANDPKYYSGPVIDYCRNGSNCGLQSITVGIGSTNPVYVGLTTGAGGTTLPGFKYDVASSRLGIFNANNATSATVNLGTGAFTLTNSMIIPTASYIYMYGAPGAGLTANAGGIGVVGTTLYSSNTGGFIRMYSTTGLENFTSPAGAGNSFGVHNATGQLFYSDSTTWKRLPAGGPVENGMTYCYGWNDSTPGYQMGGSPGVDGTFAAVVPTETCVAGTLLNAMVSQTLPTKTIRVRQYATQAAINAQCNRVFTPWTGWSDSLPIVTFSMGINNTTLVRARAGWAVNSVFTTSSDLPAASGAWIRYSTVAGDTNFMACTGDGAASSCVSTGVPIDIAQHTFEIDMSESTSVISFTVDKIGRVRKSTNLPNIATLLSWGHDITATTASSRVMSVGLQCVRR